ncbi:HEPN domain-containing protein [Paenibacillus marchantiae]|uniref:HEPN domain-containing protein n=1 Tax=Paenibacillus marchantiae TaxID=3026433 RepID=UPI00237A1B05|nr:HEPN domain-containing protein [Paenibacillus marchantiae]WDQ34557.1 HEPN domain-containing protein [Paenibacillus marchantiae]
MNHAYSYTNRQNDEFEYQRLSQYHIKLAAIMRNHNQFKACLILCDWALASMIKALYIYKYHSAHPPKELTMNEILPLVHTDTEPGLDIALFIGTMQHMSSLADYPHDQPLELNNIEKLLQRTEEILDELATRLNDNSSE